MKKVLREVLAGLQLRDGVGHGNLAFVPIVGDRQSVEDYVTLDRALLDGTLRVTEVSEEGIVPELKVVNEGDKAVLLLDGEELVGAKQNRVLNLTLLVPARSSLVIPVSCVEAGRWSRRSREFSSNEQAMFYRARSRKAAAVTRSMKDRGERRSDQAEVWREIDEKMRRMRSRSATSAMNEVYEGHRASLNQYLNGLKPVDRQIGAVFLINGRVCGCEIFEAADVFSELFPKLVRSYALDAMEERGEPAEDIDMVKRAGDFLHQLLSVDTMVHPAAGEGEDIRFDDPAISGGALLLEDRLLHLYAFASPDRSETNGREPVARMAAASRRRRMH